MDTELLRSTSLTSSQDRIERGVPIDVHFKRRFCLLKLLGVYLGTRNEDGSYAFNIGKMITAYLVWYAVPVIAFISAELIHRIQEAKGLGDDEHIHEWITSPIFIALCVFLPLLGSHSLSAITYTLKKNMTGIPTYIGLVARKSTAHTAKLEENKHWKRLRNGTVFLSSFVSTIMYLVYWVGNLMDAAEDIKKELLEEIPVFMVDIIYQILPFITTILVITFLQYFALLYNNLVIELSNLEQECTQEILEDLTAEMHKIQKSFQDMFEGFLQYAVSVNTMIIVYFGVLTAFHLSRGAHEVIYIVPGIMGATQILLMAYFSWYLAHKGEQAISTAGEVLATMQGKNSEWAGSVGTLHTLLKESPPVVRSYCGLPIAFGLAPLAVVFVLAYTGLLKAADDELGIWRANKNNTVELETVKPEYQQVF